jgi:hypothetical protein
LAGSLLACMTRYDRRLARQLGFAVLLKLALLAFLWWVFVRPFHVDASPERVAERIGSAPLLEAAKPGAPR